MAESLYWTRRTAHQQTSNTSTFTSYVAECSRGRSARRHPASETPGSAGTFILAPAFHAVNEFALRSAVEAFR